MSTSTFAARSRLRERSQPWNGAPWRAWNARAAVQTLGGLLVGAGAAALAIVMIHGTTLKGVAILIVVLGSIWFAVTRNTQFALALVMLYLGLLDGYLKLGTGSSAVTFVRDAFLFALIFGLLVRATVTHTRLPLPPLTGWLIALLVLVLVQFANPQAGTLAHSVAGARQHLEFVPLFFLTFAFVRTTKALRIFCILLALIAACNAVANLVQFNETPQQFAAWGPGYEQRVLGTASLTGRSFFAGTGPEAVSRTRPFGLGSDAGDGGLFCVLAFCGVLALAAFSKRKRDRLFAVAMALAAIVGIATSEGRGVIVSAVIALITFGFLTVTARNRITSLFALVLVVVASAFVVGTLVTATGSSGFRYAGLTPTGILSTTSKARGASIARIPYNFVTFPFGAGLGTAGPSSTAPGASELTLSGNVDTETEFSFDIVEIGIPGMLVVTGFTVMLLLIGLLRCRREPDPEARALLAAIIAPVASIFALFFSSAVTPSVPTAPYLWAVGGIVSYWLIARPAARRPEAAGAADSGATDRLPPPRPQSPLRSPVRTVLP